MMFRQIHRVVILTLFGVALTRGVAVGQPAYLKSGGFVMRGLVFALALVTGQFGFAGQPDKKDLPKPLPDNIIKAWKDAGATVGWMKVEESGILSFVEEPEAGALPAFRFLKWKDGVVAKLPVPKTSFGLYLTKTEVMDAGLKELADLKNLGSLCLCETKVTPDAVEALRKALPKCFIFHC